MKRIITIFGFLVFVGVNACAQVDTFQVYQILTIDGNQFFGRIIDSDEDVIHLRTENLGLLKISRSQIKVQKIVIPKYDQQGILRYWPENHHATRYFFGPNGYGLKKGEGYYQNNWVFFNQVSYGISDHFTLGFGVIPLFLLSSDVSPVWFTPKVSFEVVEDKLAMGGGALVGFILGEGGGGFGVAYGSTTFGSRNNNFNIGIGYGFSDDGWAETPTISLSAMLRGGEKFYFITENYWFGIGDVGIASLGGRTVWTNIALDYGFIVPLVDDALIAIPWLGVSIPFGTR